jgi:hypothetical protein
MKIDQYARFEGNYVSVGREQASAFAKGVAGDFNPIHDADSKKFCVPGDLLFTVVLHRYGVAKRMRFEFEGMVNDQTRLILPDEPGESVALMDDAGKRYMSVLLSGDHCPPGPSVYALAEQYVQFSGQAFPHILVDLMKDNQVMINPARPLVIYRNMSIELERFGSESIQLDLTNAKLEIDGKKGHVTLEFTIHSDGNEIGHGTKRMVLSGLREYDQTQMDQVVENYSQWQAKHRAAQG